MAGPLHGWDLSVAEAIALQRTLADRVERGDRFAAPGRVAGVDVAYDKARGLAQAAVAVFGFPALDLVETALAVVPLTFPYVPGLLSFRELPAVLAALAAVRAAPDLLVVDGHGLAHPRRFGIASHLGVYLDVPAIGVAKSRLVGDHDEPGPARGDHAPLAHKGEVVGAVVRTRAGVRPVYVSVGHRVSLDAAVGLALACTLRYRLPETTRAADRLSKVR